MTHKVFALSIVNINVSVNINVIVNVDVNVGVIVNVNVNVNGNPILMTYNFFFDIYMTDQALQATIVDFCLAIE